jgi:hypothetical protein
MENLIAGAEGIIQRIVEVGLKKYQRQKFGQKHSPEDELEAKLIKIIGKDSFNREVLLEGH